MITLFKSNETDFSHNGLGNLDYYIIDPVVEEVLNGLYKFTFKYPLFAPHGLEIEGQSILRVPVPGMEDQLFRVYRPVKSMGYISVSCYHIFYDLADNFIEDTNIVGKNGQGAIQQLGGATQFGHNFRFFSDIPNVANSRLVRKNVVASILDDEQANSFVSRWGGELIRNNFDVRMNKSAGTNRGFEVKYRKNLTGYEADVDYSTVVTRIMPKGFDGLLLPEKYVDSPLIGNYETPKIQMIEYEVKAAIGEYANDEDAIPLEDAYAELRRLANEEYSINKIDVPTVKYKVDFVTLEQTKEYKDLEGLQKLTIGDMVTVDHEEDQFHVEAKLVRYQYNPISKRYLLAELGSIHGGLTTSFTKVNKISREVSELKEQTLIIQSTADGKNTIYRGESEPPNPNLGDLWYKPNGAETEMYQFLEEQGQRFWKLIADTADVTSVRNDVDQALDDAVEAKNNANKAVANANLATQNATEAITQAQTSFDLAQDALTTAQGFESRIGDTEDNISTLSQTTQSFATRITDAEGNISTLTQTVQGFQTRVTDAEGNISNVTQIATALQTRITDAEGNINTLTQTATSLESTITSVRDDLENIDINPLDGGGKSFDNLASRSFGTSSVTGALIIKTPITNSFMTRVSISGYNYQGNAPDIDLTVSFYTYTNNAFHQHNFKSVGSRKINRVRLGRQNGRAIIIIEDVNTGWAYPKISVDNALIGHGNPPDSYKNGWEIAFETNLSAYTDVININGTDVQSSITQLSDAINLRVTKDDLINQINIDTTGILISGKKLILDGDTTVTGTFRVSNANITSVDAGKMATGTLDAAKVNVINLNASNITTGSVDASRLKAGTIIAGDITFRGILDGATGSFSGEVHAGRLTVSTKDIHEVPRILFDGSRSKQSNIRWNANADYDWGIYITHEDTDVVKINKSDGLTVLDGRLNVDGVRANISNLYLRPVANNEVRVANESGAYRPIRASAFNQSSSIDYKTNIETLTESALDIIDDLTVVEYFLKHDFDAGRQVGFIAEDSPAISTVDNDAINIYKLSAYNTKAIQELDSNFTNLEDRINILELENQYLKQKIKQLEDKVA